MNEWQCDEGGCMSKAVGVGGAIGLRAIGWYFKRGQHDKHGPVILCPLHRADGRPIHAAEVFARRIQEDIVLTMDQPGEEE